jgi:uncharacterized membrane protein
MLEFLIGIGVAFLIWKGIAYAMRRTYLIKKYGRELGLRILRKNIWQGMTTEQLADALGNPTDIDQEVHKTKKRETWKYGQTGKNRFKVRIHLEEGTVVGWKS